LTKTSSTDFATDWETPAAGATTLDGLTDVTVPSPADGRVLTYDTGAGQWVAKGGGITASWAGLIPNTSIPSGPVWRVPSKANVTRTFQILKAMLRVETPATGSVTVSLEKSAPGGAFAGTGILFLTLPAGSYEVFDTVTVPFVTTGELLRISWNAVDSASGQYTIQLEGIEV
jgi:hypothetical protein